MRKLLTLALVTLLTCSAYALQIPNAKITNVSVRQKDSIVTISFDAFIPKLNSDNKVTLTPVLYADSHSVTLTPIVFTGKRKGIMEKREKKPAVKVIIGKDKQTTSYRISIPFEHWMDEISLKLNSSIEGCCRDKSFASLQLLSNKLIHYNIKPVFNTANIEPKLTDLQKYDNEVAFLYPATDYANRYEIFEKTREKGALVVYFQQGYSSIDPLYKNNRQTLSQVNRVLDLIDADANASLKKIVIVGLASPEGSLVKNDILAEKRANSLKYFVGERVKFDPNLFEIINGSEDWAGLKNLVEASRMTGRWQVLEIMENYSVRGGREVELMKLDRGDPYRYMMEHFFPLLRNSGYIQIYYEFTPDPQVEMANKAIKFIKTQQYDKALPLLLSIKDNEQFENTIGVCYMMSGDYAKALTYFEKAIANQNSDAADAASNIEQIRLLQSIK